MEPSPWVEITVEADGHDCYRCSFRDHRGTEIGASDDSPMLRHFSFQSGSETVSIAWPRPATAALMDAVARSTVERVGDLVSVPIAVLIRAPAHEVQRSEEIVAILLDRLGIASHKVCLALLGPSGPLHEPISVPFTMAITRAARKVDLQNLVNSVDGGLVIVRGLTTRQAATRRRSTHILIAAGSELESLLGSGKREASPALIILTGRQPAIPIQRIPRSTSILALSTQLTATEVSDAVAGLVINLSHDNPLHEAVHGALSKLPDYEALRREIRFITTPEGLDSLRLAPALERMRQRLRDIARHRSTSAELEPEIARTPKPANTPRRANAPRRSMTPARSGTDPIERADRSAQGRRVQAERHERAMVNEGIDKAADLVANFEREQYGLGPMSRSEEYLRAAEEMAAKIEKRFAQKMKSMKPSEVESMEASQDRRVALWVTSADGGVAGLDPNYFLANGGRYTINLGVGIDWKTDLVPSDAPSLDSALPTTTDDLQLEVVAFSAESKFPEGSRRPLALGKLGPSHTVEIPFVTPTGRAATNIRVGIYHDSHLIQLLNLRAKLATREEYSDRKNLSVKVLFHRTASLTELNKFEKQSVLAIAGNSTGGPQHQLMFSTGDNLPFSESQLAGIQELHRSQLDKVWGIRKVKLPKKELETFIRSMAFAGYELWDTLFNSVSAELSDVISTISESSDPQTIQYVRVQMSFSFPWAMLYDRELPSTKAARDKLKVCLGGSADKPCLHDDSSVDVVCVRGFWGIRHVIQEFVTGPNEQSLVDLSVPGAAGQDLAYTIGTNDNWTSNLETKLKKVYGSRISPVDPNESVFDILEPARRPAVFFLIGHLSNDASKVELPDPPRIQVGTSEAWINARDSRWRKLRKSSKDCEARPVVLLLACGSGASDLTKLPEFVLRLGNIGASAVIATEEKIDTDLAAQIAEKLLADLPTIGPGESLRRWRADALAQGNPHGFLFRCFGNAHVKTKALT